MISQYFASEMQQQLSSFYFIYDTENLIKIIGLNYRIYLRNQHQFNSWWMKFMIWAFFHLRSGNFQFKQAAFRNVNSREDMEIFKVNFWGSEVP